MDRKWLMAIDASLTATALVVLGENFILRREFKTNAKDWTGDIKGRDERYMSTISQIVSVAKQLCPEYFFIEAYAYNAKGSSVVTLGEFGGVLRHELVYYFDYWAEVPPTVLKQFATGKGNAGKAAVVSAVTSRYNVLMDSDNAADAFALAKLGACVSGYEQAQTSFQQKAVETVKKLLS